MTSLSLAAIAQALGLEHRGGEDLTLTGLAPLEHATAKQLSFVSKKSYLAQAKASGAAALILHPDWVDEWSGPCLLSDQPYLSFAKATHLFDDRPVASGRIHPSAVIADDAVLDDSVTVDAGAVIESGAELAAGVWIGANAIVGEACRIGRNTRIYPGVVLYYGVHMGEDCIVHANAVIGSDGFGFAPSSQGWIKILQLGAVRIGDRVEIGASTTIDRGALGDTVLEDNVIIDNQVHVAHNVHIGARTGIAACTGIAGSTVIGRDCTLAGMVGVGDHVTIADNVHVNGQGRVSKSLTEPGVYASGTPIQPYREWSRNAVRFEQLSDMAKRLSVLEKQLQTLTSASDTDEGKTS